MTEQLGSGSVLSPTGQIAVDTVQTEIQDQEFVISGFERRLFEDGVFVFNERQYWLDARNRATTHLNWLKRTGWKKELAEESIKRGAQDAQEEAIWYARFSGRIPVSWNIWYNVSQTFEEAANQNVSLSQSLVDAGVSHPHHLVANEVGKGQKLNARQIGWLFARPNFPGWNREEIIAAQRLMGVSEETVAEGIKMAEDLLARLSKTRVEA